MVINPKTENNRPARKLSYIRLAIVIFALVGLSYWIFRSASRWQNSVDATTTDPWFAAYVDITATPRYSFEQIQNDSKTNNIVLSFIVSHKEDACEPAWGGVYTLDEANTELDLDRRIALLRQKGGTIAVSFGGQLNDELAINCEDEQKLMHAYKNIIDKYEIDTIDFDIEGEGLKDDEAMERRSKVIKDLQKMYQGKGKNLSIWLTLPVSTHGLTEEGANAVRIMLANKVEITGVNAMTMNYGDTKAETETMASATKRALNETHRQLGILFNEADQNYSDDSIWAKTGATVMIGQNDVLEEIFTLDDAKNVNEFVTSNRLSRLSMWSGNRDVQCGENYVNITVVSDSCSGIEQEKHEFANLLKNGFEGIINADNVKKRIKYEDTQQKQDDPEQSPYQIWSEEGTYLQGTKVVWHQNVYEAKWWTQGDLPDNPVLQSWETPWRLIGPVLPGEKPIPQPTLPEGTYPTWSGESIYDTGERVLFNGIPYQAKWWTQGDSPAASTSNPDSSPWVVLTQEQVREILKELDIEK